ncbi:MAG TPA: ATP-binding cassette domain-containing protein [Xanthobacteraceae bacterium]|jgi:branched-chain amino acid transport system permease protein
MKSWIALAVIAALSAALPLVGSNYLLRIATTVCMYTVMAQSWNFIGGLAGYPSFATAAFFGFGAYTSAILQNHGAPIVIGWSAAGVAALLLAAFLGGAILHLRGHYFAIASLIIAEMLREIVNTLPDFTGGGKGLNLPFLRISVTAQAQLFFYAMLALAILCVAAAIVIHRGKLGFGLRCIQQNEDAANMIGVNTYGLKTAGFCLSAVFVGAAGAIYASWVNYIDPPDVFDILLAVKPMVMVLLGGLGTIFGPPLGALILLTLEEFVWRSFLTIHAAALGLIIVLLVLFLPNGILSLLRERLSFIFAPESSLPGLTRQSIRIAGRWIGGSTRFPPTFSAGRSVPRMTVPSELEITDCHPSRSSAMAEAPKLAIAGLQAGYGDVQVLWDVTIEVGTGELVCLIGSNGAGKTTLMRCISGLLAITAGEIAVDGRNMARATPADLVRAGIAHVPEGRRLLSAMSVRDNLLMGAYLRDDKAKIAEDLDRVYAMFPILAERQRQDAGTLSGGEQQMCAIGRGLMARPSLLLIDELSLGLAPRMVELLAERLREINRSGVAVLLVEQDVMNALELAGRAYVIDRGRVTKAGLSTSLAGDPAIREAYIGVA